MPFLRNKLSFSKKLVSKKRFSYNYKCIFFVRIFVENAVFFERTAFERKPKMKKIRKNGFRKTFFNFERTLFDQTTSSRQITRTFIFFNCHKNLVFCVLSFWVNKKDSKIFGKNNEHDS